MQNYLKDSNLKNILFDPNLSRLSKLLIILFHKNADDLTISEIRKIGSENGCKEIIKWNISDIFGKNKRLVINSKNGWSISSLGQKKLIDEGILVEKNIQTKNDIKDLINYSKAIKNPQIKDFIEEAIHCLEYDQKRAAVVLSWIGAISILYDEVIKNHLSAFNAEATRRDAKWKMARTSDDLSKMKEFDFLNILESLSVIGKNVKQELQDSLKLRNGCGHPNSLKIGTRKVSAHIEILILNVFTKF